MNNEWLNKANHKLNKSALLKSWKESKRICKESPSGDYKTHTSKGHIKFL